MKEKLKGNFKYVVLLVILFIPFIYSFFYLKAYWNPYGKGNIDNLPVAIINEDAGDKGDSLIDGIKESKKLKLSVVSENKAMDGLYDGKYYAVIKIPKDFTSDMESASTDNKKHATITYSPNQKSNYLASQIINTVVLTVEKNIDNEVNSKIVEGLTDSLNEVPDSLNTINDGFSKLSDGTGKLKDGSSKILEGSSSLLSNYDKFNNGIKSLKDGSNELSKGTNKLQNELSSKINELSSDLTEEEKNEIIKGVESNPELSDEKIEAAAIYGLQNNQSYVALKNSYESGLSAYNEGKAKYDAGISQLESMGIPQSVVDACAENENANPYCPNESIAALASTKNILTSSKSQLDSLKQVIDSLELTAKETAKQTAKTVAKQTAVSVAQSVKSNATTTSKESLQTLLGYIKSISAGANKVSSGSDTLSSSSNQILDGINTLNNANNTLNSGVFTLDKSVINAKNELLSKTNETKDSLKKLESLSDYSKEPIKVETKEVNKVNSYGTAFSPLFISVGLWVGCLMLFMVLYYDKEERFGVFSINDKRLVKKTLAYHSLITISSVVLGICLDLFLDFDIANYPLYYLSFILVANVFMAIIEFLITNFKDIGKFIALILLVLQLGASAGTFPIETVNKGFRWLNTYLPMTYSIRLLKEPLVKVESSLLTKSMVVLIIIFVVFFAINIIRDITKQKKAN